MTATLGELITELIEIDLAHPEAHDAPVRVEADEDGTFWVVVG